MDKKIIDNFLPQDYFEYLQGMMLDHSFPWLYNAEVANKNENQDEHFYFTHNLFESFDSFSSVFEEFIPFFKPLDMNAM